MTPRGQQIIAAMVDTRLAELASYRRHYMTPPTTTHGAPGRDSSGGADALWYARAVIADVTDYDDATIANACKMLIGHADTDPDTWLRARDMLHLVEGEMV